MKGLRPMIGTVVLTLAIAVGAPAADPPGSPKANDALALCLREKTTSAEEKRALLARGLTLAEQAVAADDADAKAHFAVFCNLGKEMKLRGVGIGSLVAVRRLRREIDRTLELAPDYPDALLAKGSFLCELPRVLGGDTGEGERFMRAALKVDPDYLQAHLRLARVLAERGVREEARTEAQRALELATRKADPRAAEEAQALLGRLGD